ncbi:hypothetical protein D3C86_1774770 [compost metagenome]
MWLPSPSGVVGVKLQPPEPLAVAVPIWVLPSKIAMLLLASAVPERVGVLSLVVPPVGTFPTTVPTLSSAPTITGVVETVSTTILNGGDCGLSFPAGSVAEMVRAWLPSPSAPPGVKLQVPVEPTTTVPMAVPLL